MECFWIQLPKILYFCGRGSARPLRNQNTGSSATRGNGTSKQDLTTPSTKSKRCAHRKVRSNPTLNQDMALDLTRHLQKTRRIAASHTSEAENVPTSAGQMRQSCMGLPLGRLSCPIKPSGPGRQPAAQRAISGGKTHVDQPREGRKKNPHVLFRKWRNREEALTQAAKCHSHSARLIFRQVHFQSVAQLETRENVQDVKDVLMELLPIRIRRHLRVEHAHHFCKTEGARLRGTSCRGARFLLCSAGLAQLCVELVEVSLCLLLTLKECLEKSASAIAR